MAPVSDYFILRSTLRMLRPTFWLHGWGRWPLLLAGVLPFVILTGLQLLAAGAWPVLVGILVGCIVLLRRRRTARAAKRRPTPQAPTPQPAPSMALVPRNRRMHRLAVQQGRS